MTGDKIKPGPAADWSEAEMDALAEITDAEIDAVQEYLYRKQPFVGDWLTAEETDG
jgi:hypothetical protein